MGRGSGCGGMRALVETGDKVFEVLEGLRARVEGAVGG